MKIGIDARMYGPEQGGIGRYLQQLILHLEQTDHGNEYVIFLRRANWEEYYPAAPNFKKAMADVRWYGWAEQIKLPKIIAREKVDLMHFPHWNVPLFYDKPFIVTIHDLLLMHYPTREASTLGPLSYFFKNIAYRLVLRHAVRAAKRIIVPCEFTKKDIAGTLRIRPEKIEVINLAPFKKIEAGTDVRAGLGIAKPYVLYVGVAFPHKNLDALLRAWKIFTDRHGHNYQLVLAGKQNYFYKKLMQGAKPDNVVFTGFLKDGELAAIYQNAALYVFPSLYEGFGLPALEAMQYGIPVVSSDSTCLPEILGNGAYYFNPDDADSMAEVIYRGLTDSALRMSLLQNSRTILAKYSWTECARKTAALYNGFNTKNTNYPQGQNRQNGV